MRILAIETVERSGSVAALDDETLVAQRRLEARRGSARSLAPAIAALLSEAGWRPTDVALVAVAVGPGSFTGLRIGVTTAKAFAYAAGCEIVGVGTMPAIAAQADDNTPRLSVVVDAQRGELVAADFTRADDRSWIEATETRVLPADEWLASRTTVAGPALAGLVDRLPAGVNAAARSSWGPTAEAVGKLGLALYRAGERSSPFDLVPRYARRAAAEERRGGQANRWRQPSTRRVGGAK